MSRGVKIGLIIGVIVLGGGEPSRRGRQEEAQGGRGPDGQGGARDLVAAVTASGKIDAEKTVDITADITGRILHIAVKEGDA